MKPPPRWLGELQAAFGAALRAPLDASTGTFRASTSSYPATAVSASRGAGDSTAAERLATYNRQYWFRLFGVLQSAFPLTTRLMGHFTFNEWASRFLVAHPPRGWNIDRAADGFESFLADSAPPEGVKVGRRGNVVDLRTITCAARIDAAWRSVFAAPVTAPFRPGPNEAPRLLLSRLVPSPSVAIFEEHRPLVELRRRLEGIPGEAPIPAPAPLAQTAFWAFVKKPQGIGHLPLEAAEARLMLLLRDHTVAEAVTLLESESTEEQRALLPGKVQSWLSRSVELDFWRGIEPDQK
jgi:hypothetical protein